MRRVVLTVCAALTLPLAACQGADHTDETSTSAETVTVRGEASYRERIALPPGSMLEVRVVDLRRPDSASGAIAEGRFDASQVPIPFALAVEVSKIEPNVSHGVSARVRDAGDALWFETEAPVPVDLKAPAPLEIWMVRAGGGR